MIDATAIIHGGNPSKSKERHEVMGAGAARLKLKNVMTFLEHALAFMLMMMMR